MSVVLHLHNSEAPERRDAELWARLQTGEQDALEGLFRGHAASLCDFAVALLRDDDAARDIVQALFCWLWDHRFALEEPRSVRRYLFVAVRNRCANHARSQRTAARFAERLAASGGPVVTPVPATDAAAGANDLESAIAREVALLTPRRRDVFSLVRFQGLRHKEVAEILGIAPKTVEIHLAQALEILKERLSPWLGI